MDSLSDHQIAAWGAVCISFASAVSVIVYAIRRSRVELTRAESEVANNNEHAAGVERRMERAATITEWEVICASMRKEAEDERARRIAAEDRYAKAEERLLGRIATLEESERKCHIASMQYIAEVASLKLELERTRDQPNPPSVRQLPPPPSHV